MRVIAGAILLLCLMAHAALVSATHCHIPSMAAGKASSEIVEASQSGGSDRAPDSENHNDCLSCRLNRHFISIVHSPHVILDLASGPVIRDTLPLDLLSSEPFFISVSRAPPLA